MQVGVNNYNPIELFICVMNFITYLELVQTAAKTVAIGLSID